MAAAGGLAVLLYAASPLVHSQQALRSLASDVVPELFAGFSRVPGSAGLDQLVAIAQKLLGIQEQQK